jgi:phosphohistidine phosphatase SixA
MIRYLILARHGEVDRTSAAEDRMQHLSDKGQAETKVVAGVLRERLTLAADGPDFSVARILYSQYRHAVDGAEVFSEQLSKAGVQVPLEPSASLTPSSFMQPVGRERRLAALCDDLLKRLAALQASDGSAMLLVGHAPHMDWIAGRLLRGRAWQSYLASTEASLPVSSCTSGPSRATRRPRPGCRGGAASCGPSPRRIGTSSRRSSTKSGPRWKRRSSSGR